MGFFHRHGLYPVRIPTRINAMPPNYESYEPVPNLRPQRRDGLCEKVPRVLSRPLLSGRVEACGW